jgi:hypothetical protein
MGSVARESGSAERGEVASVRELAGQLTAKDGKVKVGIIGSQLAADLHAEGSTFGNSGPEQSQYASSHQLRYVGAPISTGRAQYLQSYAVVDDK